MSAALIEPSIFKPYGGTDDYGDLIDQTVHKVNVHGVDYLTDRFVIVRSDLVQPLPAEMFASTSQEGIDSIDRFITMAFNEPVVDQPPHRLAAMYVAVFEAAGLELIPTPKLWKLRIDGATVGFVAPLKNDERSEKSGVLPGGITAAHRIVHGHLKNDIENQWEAWQAAVNIVLDLKVTQ